MGSKTKDVNGASPKKEIRRKVGDGLKTTLETYEVKLSKKKLESRIRKASKLLTKGVKIRGIKSLDEVQADEVDC